tara:strand:- start:6420 stop:7502 length:1083 start_codon:yes stop_codon:yes gene_type:complete
MASRTQVKYGSAGLFVGPTPSTGAHTAIKQLHRVQSVSDTFDLPLEDVNQFGQTAALDKVVNSSPTPTMEFTYYTTDGHNEVALGMPIDGTKSIASFFLDGTQDDKNYFSLFTKQGVDVVSRTPVATEDFVVGIGNGFVSSYSVSASVGGFMESSVSIEGSNYSIKDAAGSVVIPAINPTDGTALTETYTIPAGTTGEVGMPSVIKKGDIAIAGLPATLIGVDLSEANVQSFSVSVDLPREALERLGSDFVFARPLQTPINATVSLDFAVTDIVEGSLSDLFTSCSATSFDFTITASPCVGSAKSETFKIVIKGAFFESENTSTDIGSDRNGSVSFTVPIGAASDTTRGIFLDCSSTTTL